MEMGMRWAMSGLAEGFGFSAIGLASPQELLLLLLMVVVLLLPP